MTEVKHRFFSACAYCTTIAIGTLSIITLAVLMWVFML